ncbi:MAG: DUF4202 domain-containing protein [Verrucomicrobia bacterium]|nr:MAG: DUF4202 domain-containing protein [Verrucomicrobiota bacterium]
MPDDVNQTKSGAARFEAAIRRFDRENSRDPNLEIVEGIARPRELIYAERLTDWVLILCPDASEDLRLSARCQHLCWCMIPRGDLKKFHADKAGEILRELGYPEETVARVQALNLKKDFPQHPDSRVLEDGLCLVFLEFQFAELAARTAGDKIVNALQKSWKKMTPAAREQAMKLNYGSREQALIERALEQTGQR